MAVSIEIVKTKYAGNGATTQFPIQFQFIPGDVASIRVQMFDDITREEIPVSPADYTLEPPGDNPTSVQFLIPPAVDTTVFVSRHMPLTQVVDYIQNGAFLAESHEQGLDRIVMQVQQIADLMGRVLSLNILDEGIISAELPPAIDDAVLGTEVATDGLVFIPRSEFKGDKGDVGDKGDTGEIDGMSVVGELDYDDPTPMSVTNVGTSTNAILEFILRKGPKGDSTVLITTTNTLPDDGIGSDGDLWIVLNAVLPEHGDVYQRESGTYVLKGNIQGPPGGVDSIDTEQGPLVYDLSGLYSARFNKIITGNTLRTMLTEIYDIQYSPPGVALTSNVGVGPYEKGFAITAINFTANLTRRSEPITQLEFLRGATVLDTQTSGGGIPDGGPSTYSWSGSVVDTTTFSARVTDGVGAPQTANRTFSYVFAYFTGPGAPGLNDGQVVGLTKEVINSSADKTVSYNLAVGQVPYFAYPASYGDLATINDANGFDVTSSFTKRVMSLTNTHSQTTSYNVYEHNNPWGVSETTTFRFRR